MSSKCIRFSHNNFSFFFKLYFLDKKALSVPSLLVVLHGGVNTLTDIMNAIDKGNREAAIVIISGSGGIADLLSYAFALLDDGKIDTMYESMKFSKLRQRIENYFKRETEEVIERVYTEIRKCLDTRKMVIGINILITLLNFPITAVTDLIISIIL